MARRTVESTQNSPCRPQTISLVIARDVKTSFNSVRSKASDADNPDELVSMTRQLGPRASAGTPRQAAEFGSVVLFAVPYDALPQLARDLQEALRDKIVLDACNPAPGSDDALAREAMADGVAQTSTRYLPGARLVRAFSAVDATAIAASAGRHSGKLGVPVAGDDAQAVQVAAQLVRDVGCEPVIVGALAATRGFRRRRPGLPREHDRTGTAAPARPT